MKSLVAAGLVCLLLGFAAVGCVSETEDGTIFTESQTQVKTITARDIAALAPGESLDIDLESTQHEAS